MTRIAYRSLGWKQFMFSRLISGAVNKNKLRRKELIDWKRTFIQMSRASRSPTLLAIDHPRNAILIHQHAKRRRPECLL